MTLVFEIEYLSGVVFAAKGQDSPEPDWPPEPDRIFSALVATWGAHGLREEEGSALEWLEELPPPLVAASTATPRTSAGRFVPPNDAKSGRTGNPEILPIRRRRQSRLFPATRPDEPLVRFYWEKAAPNEQMLNSLQQLASDTSYVGHSASLTRCRFTHSQEPAPTEARHSRRWVYEGRFRELREDFAHNRRPKPGVRVISTAAPTDRTPQSYFSADWMILEHTGGAMPDIRAAALIAKEIRNTILSGYKQINRANDVPEAVSGHTSEGSPTPNPHLAIVPLAFAGTHLYADGHLLGFALVPPRESEIWSAENGWSRELLQAMRAVAPFNQQIDRRALKLESSGEERGSMRLRQFGLVLSPTLDSAKKSLSPVPYTATTRRFATVTPVVLDRYLKSKTPAEREEEIQEQIEAACTRIGLPAPIRIVPGKHSAVTGAPSAHPSGCSPDWMRWQMPRSLAGRFLTHALIEFSEPVQGPVILGAGRFVGLGLCMPWGTVERDV
jgi:CRISPR-associated protein Csb2